MNKNFIAYQGTNFTVEWYFNTQGKSIALDYLKELPIDKQRKFFHALYVLANTGKIFNTEKFRYEGDKIYAIKVSPDRFLCFFFRWFQNHHNQRLRKKGRQNATVRKRTCPDRNG
jgi:hypothetical protein